MFALTQNSKRRSLHWLTGKEIIYDSETENSYIFREAVSLEAFADDNDVYFNLGSSTLNRGQLLSKYLLEHPNSHHLLRNGARLWFLTANLRADERIRRGELTWKEFLSGTETTSSWCGHQALGYALIAPAKCLITGLNFMTLEWLATFVADKHLDELLLKQLEIRFGCKFLFRDTRTNLRYHSQLEARTHYTAKSLLAFCEKDANCQQVGFVYLQKFTKANGLTWHDDFLEQVASYWLDHPFKQTLSAPSDLPCTSLTECKQLFEQGCFVETLAGKATTCSKSLPLHFHPELTHLLQNKTLTLSGTCLHFLMADLELQVAVGQLSWSDYLLLNESKESPRHGKLATCCALVTPSLLRHAGLQRKGPEWQEYGKVEWLQAFYPGKELERVLLDLLRKKLGLALLPANTEIQAEYYECEEQKTRAISSALIQLLSLSAESIPSLEQLQDFVLANKLGWHTSFTKLVMTHLELLTKSTVEPTL